MKICKGNVQDAAATISTFLEKYGSYICRADEAKICEIDADMVFEACTKAKDTVGGMGGWEVKELALFFQGNMHLVFNKNIGWSWDYNSLGTFLGIEPCSVRRSYIMYSLYELFLLKQCCIRHDI